MSGSIHGCVAAVADSESDRAAIALVIGVEAAGGNDDVEEFVRVGGAGVLSRSLSSNDDRDEDERDDIEVRGDSSSIVTARSLSNSACLSRSLSRRLRSAVRAAFPTKGLSPLSGRSAASCGNCLRMISSCSATNAVFLSIFICVVRAGLRLRGRGIDRSRGRVRSSRGIARSSAVKS